MNDFDWYRLFKTLHVISIIMLGSGIAIESICGPIMPRVKSVQELRILARITRTAELALIIPSFVLIPLFGYLTGSKEHLDFGASWISIAQPLYYLAVLLSLVFLLPASFRLYRKLNSVPDGPMTAELTAEVKKPLPAIFGAITTVLYFIVVYLMVAKPNW